MGSKNKKRQMAWWQLSLLGVGCTIGTGFFLGSSIAIKKSGPAVLISFVLAAIGTYIVYDALAKMSVDHPDKDSFRSYAKKAFGKWAGFSNGWVYCFSEMLIMGSQLTALGIFTQFWFPAVPLWLLTTIYSVLGLLVILTGMQGFEKIENIFGVVKTAAMLMFILIATIIVIRGIKDNPSQVNLLIENNRNFFSEGVKGIWVALLYAFYAFGGIEVMGLLVIDLKDPKQAPKAGKIMIGLLVIIYIVSIGFVLALVSWQKIQINESPFITAIDQYQIPYAIDVLNGVLIIAGFSTMVAALYSVLTILTSLAEDHDAPAFLAKKGKLKVPLSAFLFVTGGLFISIMVALLLPEKIFEYMTTAAGLMLLYNWCFILATFTKLMKLSMWERVRTAIGMLLIFVTVLGALGEKTSRIGLYVSLLFLIIIGMAAWIMRKRWSKV